jgi:uroporphyrinogen-III synthase
MKMFRLLSTRKLSARLVQHALANGIDVINKEFITTRFCDDAGTVSEVRRIVHFPTTVVFSSKNAVKAVAAIVDLSKSDWKIFCIDGATSNEVKKYFSDTRIIGTAKYAKELASVIIASQIEEGLVFFCGNKRLDELPQLLRTRGKEVKEVVVYDNELTPEKISDNYDGVAFFSPSAVESFFSVNKLRENAICFSVGRTTSEAIKKFTSNTVITSDVPAEENVIDLALTYSDR